MITRQKQTMAPNEQPVRFYKIVAMTFLFLTVILLGVIIFMSSKRATIVIESKATPVDIADSVLIGKGNISGSLKGNVVAKELALTQEFYPTGTREEAAKAEGIVTLHNDSKISQPLVATTRLLTSDNVLFRLKEKAVVPAGGTVDVAVVADLEGAGGNIGPANFTIPGLAANRQKEVYGTSAAAMAGGVRQFGVLSADDINKAKEQVKGALQKQGENELSSDNMELTSVFSLKNESYEVNAKEGDEVSSFSVTGKGEVVGVFYSSEELKVMADKFLARRAVDDVEIIEPSKNPPTVVVEDYDLNKGTATIQIFHNGVTLLNPESKQLDKAMFFGKSKDEVRRYLLKLDHVRSVEIKFSPAWIRTVPYVGDHVDVVVKEVQ